MISTTGRGIMILTANRLGHILNGAFYPTSEGRDFDEYVSWLRHVYGTLHGVKVVTVLAGINLVSRRPWAGYVVPYPTQYVVHKIPRRRK